MTISAYHAVYLQLPIQLDGALAQQEVDEVDHGTLWFPPIRFLS